jgi:hypothetical protein
MIKRILIAIGLFAACGSLAFFRPALYRQPDEAWLESVTPEEVDGMEYFSSKENPEQSYKMSAETYTMLNPSGICSRIFDSGKGRYDAVVIAGDNADSFHDQRNCFSAQGWEIVADDQTTLEVPGAGTVPAVQLELNGPNGRAWAIYCFRGPSGKVTSQFGTLWRDFFFGELKTGKVQQGQFFRFIALDGDESPDKLKEFAGKFMAQALPRIDEGLKKR